MRGENRTDILIDNSVKEFLSGYTGTSYKDEAETVSLADESRNETIAEENSKIFFVTKFEKIYVLNNTTLQNNFSCSSVEYNSFFFAKTKKDYSFFLGNGQFGQLSLMRWSGSQG